MRAQEVIKEDIHGDQAIGTGEGIETAFGVVPGFELAMEGFDEIVGNPVVEILDPDMPGPTEEQGNRFNVRPVTVGDNG